MYRVQIHHESSGKKVFYGKPSNSLLETHETIASLEEEWAIWCGRGYPPLPSDNPIQFLEGSDVYVVSDNGLIYVLDDESNFQVLN